MQKKLIALAVAGLVSAPAFAQSNVQIYGIMDLGFARHSGSENDSGGLDPTDKSRTGIDSGNQAASRIGFRGTEDLGNGLKAFFQIEQGLNADRASTPTNRQIFVGLQGDFGKVRLGRDFNPSRSLVTGLDPFGASGVGNVQNIYQLQTRVGNAIIYTSPNMGGFTAEVTFTNNVDGNESAYEKGDDNPNDRLWNVVGKYSNGPLMVGASYERIKNDAADGKIRAWNLVGSYDFGVVSLRGAYGQVKTDVGPFDSKAKQWMVAGVIPVSEAGSVLVSYNRIKIDTDLLAGDPKASQWAVGYKHNLSKRTNVYATYAKVSTNNEAEGGFGVYGGSNDNVFTSGLNVGIRHNF